MPRPGAVAERLGRGLQSLVQRFESARRLIRSPVLTRVAPVKPRVVVLGAGFGGLELATVLSEALGEDVDLTVIDQNDAFVFGYSKLDVMFGRTTADAVRLPYREIAKPGMRFLQRTVTSIDPVARRVTTDDGDFEADFLVVALGALSVRLS